MSKPTQISNLQTFREAHDPNVIVPKKIRAALETLLKEHKEAWRYESQFCTLAGISNTHLGAFRDQFAEHIVETGGRNPKRVWFADAKIAEKVRNG